jgi:nicotinamidase/pyrazinamidase
MHQSGTAGARRREDFPQVGETFHGSCRTTSADSRRAALLIVDVQNDFCAGGALPVPHSDHVITSLNEYVDGAVREGTPIYASRDWHPARTSHFARFGGQWPVHCVQDTDGAKFHPALRLPPATTIISKGDRPDAAAYSAFDGHTSDGVPLLEHLRAHGISDLYVGGLATDYCVKASVIDALAAGFYVTVLRDAIAGVDVNPGDSAQALDEMREQGARLEDDGGRLFAR